MKLSTLWLLAATLFLAACGGKPVTSSTKEEWNRINDPLNLSGSYNHKFAELPVQGALETDPWSDTYWPSTQAGIAARWKDWSANNFEYELNNLQKLRNMTVAELAKLSPAEKYDIYIGRYDYPLVKAERGRTSPDAQGWEGLCHGWAPAATLFAEPKPVLVTGANGIKIPFGSADVKALLTYLQGQYSRARSRMLGGRCNIDLGDDPDAANRPECRDTNAGAFHVVIANQLGLKKQAFVADITRDYQVWNQPVSGFESRVIRTQQPSPGAAPGTVEEVVIETTMDYGVETGAEWDALVGTDNNYISSRTYQYRVELNANGYIIGGEWENEGRPDFLWMQDRAQFSGYFRQLGRLYNESANNADPLKDPTLGDDDDHDGDDDN